MFLFFVFVISRGNSLEGYFAGHGKGFARSWLDGNIKLAQTNIARSVETVIRFTIMILKAYENLHEHSIRHEDVKPENMLIQSSTRPGWIQTNKICNTMWRNYKPRHNKIKAPQTSQNQRKYAKTIICMLC